MDSFSVIFASAIGFFAAIILAMNWLTFRRRRQSGQWKHTDGRILKFGVSYGVPEVAYSYEVDGQPHYGTAMVVGALRKHSTGLKVRRAAYVDERGALKFPHGAVVPVYYNPARPDEAALVRASASGVPWGLLVALLLISGMVAFLRKPDWFEQHGVLLIGATLFLAGWVLLGVGFGYLRRHARTKTFPSTPGHLDSTQVVYRTGQDNGSGGFSVEVCYHYEVGAIRYESRQWSALAGETLSANSAQAQAEVDRLKSAPALTVYYDPGAPWDAFLRHGPLGAPFAAFAVSIGMLAMGLFILAKGH